MLSFFPRGVLDEILNLIESVSEDFPSYSCRVVAIWDRFSVLAVSRRLFCFDSLVVLDVVCGYVLLVLLDIKIENR